MTSIRDTVLTELNASWNTSVIAKPNFFNKDIPQSTKTIPSVVVGELNPFLKPASINNIAKIRKWDFIVKCYADTRANCDLVVGECWRIIDNKSISGGWWTVESAIPDQGNPLCVIVLHCSSTLWTTSKTLV